MGEKVEVEVRPLVDGIVSLLARFADPHKVPIGVRHTNGVIVHFGQGEKAGWVRFTHYDRHSREYIHEVFIQDVLVDHERYLQNMIDQLLMGKEQMSAIVQEATRAEVRITH